MQAKIQNRPIKARTKHINYSIQRQYEPLDLVSQNTVDQAGKLRLSDIFGLLFLPIWLAGCLIWLPANLLLTLMRNRKRGRKGYSNSCRAHTGTTGGKTSWTGGNRSELPKEWSVETGEADPNGFVQK